MKRVICFLLCMTLCCACLFSACAETAEDAIHEMDQMRVRWGFTMVAQMMGNACDRLDDTTPDTLRGYYKQFIEIDLLKPYKALVIELTEEQAKAACDALGAEETVEIAPALAAHLNTDYPDYAKAVTQILPEKNQLYANPLHGLVLLTYERHIAVISFDGNEVRGALIISMESSSRSLNAGEINFYAAKIGVDNLQIRMYMGEELDQLLEWDSWTTNNDSGTILVSAVKKTAGRLLRLFPKLLAENTLTDAFRFSMLRAYLEDYMSTDLVGSVRLVSEKLLPMMAESNPNVVDEFMATDSLMFDTRRNERKAPDIAYADEILPDSDATYAFVIEWHHPERETESFYDPVLEAALPAKCIPDNLKDAECIIRCKVTYGDTPDLSNSNSAIYCPTTEITVHDAKTGSLICNLGSVTLPKPTGIVIVSKGNHYYKPDLGKVWEKVKIIFEK